MNLQDASKSGQCIRRAPWIQGEYVLFNKDHESDPREPEFVYPVYFDHDNVYAEWVPIPQDRLADDWEVYRSKERLIPGRNAPSKMHMTVSVMDAKSVVAIIKSLKGEVSRLLGKGDNVE